MNVRHSWLSLHEKDSHIYQQQMANAENSTETSDYVKGEEPLTKLTGFPNNIVTFHIDKSNTQ